MQRHYSNKLFTFFLLTMLISLLRCGVKGSPVSEIHEEGPIDHLKVESSDDEKKKESN